MPPLLCFKIWLVSPVNQIPSINSEPSAYTFYEPRYDVWATNPMWDNSEGNISDLKSQFIGIYVINLPFITFVEWVFF